MGTNAAGAGLIQSVNPWPASCAQRSRVSKPTWQWFGIGNLTDTTDVPDNDGHWVANYLNCDQRLDPLWGAWC